MASVSFEPPAGWKAAELERPTIAEGTGATLTQWAAYRSPVADETFVAGCVGTPIPGWVEDMRPPVEARTTALLGAAAAKITGAPVDVRGAGAVFELRPASDVGGAPIGTGRTFIGFEEARVLTCFAACATRRTASEGRACDGAVAAARLEDGRSPPPPGLALRGATWAVHHPRPTALAACGVILLAGILAVGLRRRPRSTIH